LVGSEIPKYVNEYYRGISIKHTRIKTKEGVIIWITVPIEATDSATYIEIYRRNYKRYMK
jgi:hypothetical protein